MPLLGIADDRLDPGAKLAVQYFKQVFESKCYFSMPSELFQAWVDAGEFTARVDDPPDAVEKALVACCRVPIDIDFSALDVAVFRVVNVTPESRFKVPVSHLVATRTQIVIKLCDVVVAKPHRQQLLVQDGTLQSKLDLVFMVDRMESILPYLCRWEAFQIHTTAVTKREPLQLKDVYDADSYALPPQVGVPSSSSSAAPSVALALLDVDHTSPLDGAARVLAALHHARGDAHLDAVNRISDV